MSSLGRRLLDFQKNFREYTGYVQYVSEKKKEEYEEYVSEETEEGKIPLEESDWTEDLDETEKEEVTLLSYAEWSEVERTGGIVPKASVNFLLIGIGVIAIYFLMKK